MKQQKLYIATCPICNRKLGTFDKPDQQARINTGLDMGLFPLTCKYDGTQINAVDFKEAVGG